MIIGIDIDDVLADFTSRFAELANLKFGRPPIGAEPIDWHWSNYCLTKDEISALWDDIRRTYNFWETLHEEPGSKWRLVGQLDMRHTLIFPTARVATMGADVAKQSARWLQNHYGIEFPTVFAAHDKSLLAQAAKYDYFIDDRPENCLAVKTALPGCNVFLKNSSHNVSFILPKDIVRIPNINDFCELILTGGVN